MSIETVGEWLDEHRSALFLGVIIGCVGFRALDLWYSRDTNHFAADPIQHGQHLQGPPQHRPWFPGAPRNPQECIARGGIDIGTGCRGWH